MTHQSGDRSRSLAAATFAFNILCKFLAGVLPCLTIGTTLNSQAAVVPVIQGFSVGGTNMETGWGIALDTDSRPILCGWFSGPLSLGGQTLAGTNTWNLFLSKLNPAGRPLWIHIIAGSSHLGSNWSHHTPVACDTAGNIFVCGTFNSTLSIGGNAYTPDPDASDIFLARFSSAGKFQWVQRSTGPGIKTIAGKSKIGVDEGGNAYLCGWTKPEALSAGLTGFVRKYSPTGQLIWDTAIGNPSQSAFPWDIVNHGDEVYVAGQFSKFAMLGFHGAVASGSSDIFLLKLSGSGTYLWTMFASSTASDAAHGLDTDAEGNVYLCGKFGYSDSSPADFALTNIQSHGGGEAFIAKYSALGSFQWARPIGGPDHDAAESIRVDRLGNSYVSGSISSNALFGSIALSNSAGAQFLASYDAHGNPRWARSFGHSNITCEGSAALAPDGTFWQIATFTNTANLGQTTFESAGETDTLIIRGSILSLSAARTSPPTTPARIDITGVPACGNVILETSMDLNNWIPVSTNEAAGIPLNYTPTAIATGYRYFRAYVP